MAGPENQPARLSAGKYHDTLDKREEMGTLLAEMTAPFRFRVVGAAGIEPATPAV